MCWTSKLYYGLLIPCDSKCYTSNFHNTPNQTTKSSIDLTDKCTVLHFVAKYCTVNSCCLQLTNERWSNSQKNAKPSYATIWITSSVTSLPKNISSFRKFLLKQNTKVAAHDGKVKCQRIGLLRHIYAYRCYHHHRLGLLLQTDVHYIRSQIFFVSSKLYYAIYHTMLLLYHWKIDLLIITDHAVITSQFIAMALCKSHIFHTLTFRRDTPGIFGVKTYWKRSTDLPFCGPSGQPVPQNAAHLATFSHVLIEITAPTCMGACKNLTKGDNRSYFAVTLCVKWIN